MDYEIEGEGYSRKTFSKMVFPRLQKKIIGLVALAATGSSVFGGLAFYYLIHRQLVRLLEAAHVPSEVQVEQLNNLSLSFGYLLVVSLAFAALVVGLSIYLAHHVVGPIYKVCKTIEDFEAGNTQSRISLRKGDEFLLLSDKVNRLLDRISANTSKNPKVG